MKKIILFLLTFGFLTTIDSLLAQGTTFSYQGQLQNNGGPANGNYDFTFALFNNNSTNTGLVGGPFTNLDTGVTNGLFIVPLNFGGVFTGSNYWLAIGVRTNGGNGFTGLNPLQEVTPTPYAIYAPSAGSLTGNLPASQLSGTIASSNFANGTITSNLLAAGSVGSNQIAAGIGVWSQVGSNIFYNNGNVGIGTNNPTAPLFVQGIAAYGSGTIVGVQTSGPGYAGGVFGQSLVPGGNGVSGDSDIPLPGQVAPYANVGVFGQSSSTNGAGVVGDALAASGLTIGVYGLDESPQGYAGWFQGNAYFSGNVGIGTLNPQARLQVVGKIIGGGSANTIASNLIASTIAGGGIPGYGNSIAGESSFIGAGNSNTIGSNINNSFIGAGYENNMAAVSSFIGGGNFNTILSNTSFSFIGSGEENSISTNEQSATISGGAGNQANGNYSTVPGGDNNVAAGQYSFAAGDNAHAAQDGTFVWADAEGPAFASSTANSFNVRAAGGVNFVTGGAGMNIDGQRVIAGVSVVSNGAPNGNFFAGSGSGEMTTTGGNNTAVGSGALFYNTNGGWNTAVGQGALFQNTAGYQNTALGQAAMFDNTNGIENTAIGAGAFEDNLSGSADVAIGFQALNDSTNNGDDTAVGIGALFNSTGNNNLGLGANAGYYTTTGNNNIEIGNIGGGGDDSIIRLGTPGVQTVAAIAGNVGIGTDTPQQSLSIVGGLNIDQDVQNPGNVNSNALTFGSDSGEGIASDRVASGTQYDLEFYTGYNNRIEILNNGNIGIGTTNPATALQVQGTVAATSFSGSGSALTALPANAALLNATQTFTGQNSFSARVGIGTTSPLAGLDVETSVPVTNGTWWYFKENTLGTNTDYSGSPSIAIYTTGAMGASTYYAFSDARIKNIIGPSSGAKDLNTLRAIDVTDYTFKDVVAKGNSPQKKVIAQQVEKVYPQAVHQTTGVVPDIYKESTVKDGWVQLATDLKVGERVKLVGEQDQGVHQVLEVRRGAFRTDFNPASGKVFVYGREVNDFRTVDYEALSMLNVSATQELARKLDTLETRLNQAQAEKDALLKHLAVLEARDQSREDRLTRIEALLEKGSAGATYASANHP